MKLESIVNPENKADEIYNLGSQNFEVFKDQNGECYAVIENEVVYFGNIDSMLNRLRNLYFNTFKKTIKNTEIKTALQSWGKFISQHIRSF